jgi:FKBP-type peptidyl-prolyl cis-trans isomerase SlyD
MQISKNKVVAIDYTLKSDDGELLDTSAGEEPLAYLHGVGGIIPGLERELEGKQVGDELHIKVAPADAYGERDDALEQEVALDQFEDAENLALGMQFQVESDQGPVVVTVVEIDDDVVTIDANHPMAGVNLNFDVTVREVREASTDELSHGHVHGAGGCDHE